jgi:hypothetical protein
LQPADRLEERALVATFTLDEQSVVVEANDALVDLVKRPTSDLRGRPVFRAPLAIRAALL